LDTPTIPVYPELPADGFAIPRRAAMKAAAERALDDPVRVARAARIVKAALARPMLDPAELLPAEAAREGQ
jgi:hypothetical protein